MRGRLYSSWASSTWSFPSALTRVLGEDVEDQLRAVDDARLERVLERPLLGRVELVVDEQHVGAGVRVERLQLLELALADVRARVRLRAVLDELADGLDARGARELAELAELLLGVDALREHGEQEAPLRLGARRRVRVGASSPGVCRYARPMAALAERLAARTLELVDIPSESRHEAEVRSHVRIARPRRPSSPSTWPRTRSSSRAAAAPERRSSSSPATTTRCRRRTTCPAGSRAAPCTASAPPT